MSKMAELAMEVEEMLENGHDYKVVAEVLNIPLSWVIATAEEMVSYDPFAQFDDVPF